MSSVSDHLMEHFETLVEGEAAPARRRASEAALQADATGRLLLVARDMWRQPLETAPPADLAERVMAGLPELPPGGRSTLAELILAGWTDLATREAMRRDPRAVLAARGVAFPEQTAVETSAPSEARLPHADRVTLPLPAPGRGPVPPVEALRQLGASELGWLWGPPWARGEAAGPRRAAPRAPVRFRWLAPALAAGAAMVVLAWMAGLALLGGGELSGAASAEGDVVPALVWGAGLVVAVIVAWFWWRRR